MDIVSHAIAGAFTGAVFGNPLLGAAVAVVPDLALGFSRKEKPTFAYDFNHSLPGLALATLTGYLLGLDVQVIFFSWLSHIAIDLPTHGKLWAPPLFYPFSTRRYSYGAEWEFFNQSHKKGMLWTALWCLSCMSVA